MTSLELKLRKGELNLDEILKVGKADRDKKSKHSTLQKANEDLAKKAFADCLMKLKSLRSFGGDVFFAGLAKVFVAKPMIPGGFSI